jgi:uncharacterized protein
MTTHATIATSLRAGFALCCIMAASAAMSASFHCSQNSSTAEKVICNDPELSRMDEVLARTFKLARQQAANRRAFTAASDQQWLWREKNCRDRSCLINWYQQRQAQLQASLDGGNAPVATGTSLPQAAETTVANPARLQLSLTSQQIAGVAPQGATARPHYLSHNKGEYLYRDPTSQADEQPAIPVRVRYLGIEHGQYILEAQQRGQYVRYTCSADCALIGQLSLPGDVERDMVIIENDHTSLPSQMVADAVNGLLAQSGVR